MLLEQPHSFHSQPTAEHNIDSFLRDDFSWRHAAAMMSAAALNNSHLVGFIVNNEKPRGLAEM